MDRFEQALHEPPGVHAEADRSPGSVAYTDSAIVLAIPRRLLLAPGTPVINANTIEVEPSRDSQESHGTPALPHTAGPRTGPASE